MKKFLALFLASVMLFSLAACTGSSDPKETKADDPKENVSEGGGNVQTPLWTLSYDTSVWTLDEENLSDDDDYCFGSFIIPDPDDSESYIASVEIKASLEEPYSFREDLVYYGYDQYSYAVDNAYDVYSVGKVDCLKYESEGWNGNTLTYFNRVEAANADVYVVITAEDTGNEKIKTLLEGLEFTLEDIGNEDGPWEWEGEPFSTDDLSVSAGGFTIDTHMMNFEGGYFPTFETFDHSVAVTGDDVYILTEGTLMLLKKDGDTLVYNTILEIPEDDYDLVQSTDDGAIWLTGSFNDVLKIEDQTIVAQYEDLNTLVVHPSGKWGIDYFSSNECQKITFTDESSYTAEDMIFEEADTIMNLFVDDNYIYVCGSAADDSGHKVFIYDANGNLQMTLCDAEGEGLGSITFVTLTDNGFIGFDGNMRDVILWDTDGNFIAEIEDSELFGTEYPWFCSSDLLSDGSIFTIMTEEREDRSATELLAFIVKGF